MNVRSPRRQRFHAFWSTKWISRIFTLVWSMGFGVCFYLLISQYRLVSQSVPWAAPSKAAAETDREARYSYNRNTGSFQSNSAVNDQLRYPAVEESKENEAQRQKAARENQAWLSRRFQIGNKLPPLSSVAAKNDSGDIDAQADKGPSMNLPNWMAFDAPKHAKTKDDVEYMSEECRSFNHTIPRPTHGCQVNPDTLQVYCVFKNLRIDNTRIHMDRGGEPLKEVMGREEFRELPSYDKGAFSTRPKPNYDVPIEYRIGLHYMEDVLNSMKYPTKKNKGEFDSNCIETRPGTTLFLTRYEYVNLYHTLTDWWNAFFVMTDDQKNGREKVRVVFLDAHAQGNLDSVWQDVFGPFEYVNHLPQGGVCFERAAFIPPGYLATIFPEANLRRVRCPLRRLSDEFSSHFLTSYGLEAVRPIPGKVVIIDRKPYVSHPRSKLDSLHRVMPNLADLQILLRKNPKVTSVEVVRFETMSFAEQIRVVREAQILIGNHGAGLSHLMFMDRSSHVLEFSTDYRDFFTYLADWKDITHTPIPVADENLLSESELLRTSEVVNSIVTSAN